MKAAFEAASSFPRGCRWSATTVSEGGVEMGRAAGDMLFDMMAAKADRDTVADVALEPTLVVLDSTAAPSA